MEDNIKILCVDDDQAILYIYEEVLALVGYNVYTAENVQKGTNLFQEHEHDLVITDLNMDMCNGIEMKDNIKKIKASTPVLLVAGTVNIKQYLQNGFDDVLDKPFGRAELLSKVKKLLIKK